MPVLYVPVGIPGCGKSTYGKSLKKCTVVSSDALREKFFGDEEVQADPNFAESWAASHGIDLSGYKGSAYADEVKSICNHVVFDTMMKTAREELLCGRNVYYDATNLSSKRRVSLLHDLRNCYDTAVAVYFDVPLETCRKRNRNRQRIVPYGVISQMHRNLSRPSLEEGFSSVRVISEREEDART